MISTSPEQGLTSREREILDWVVVFLRERGRSPSVREVGDAFGVTTSAVSRKLRSLERKGYLRPWPAVDRPTTVTSGSGREQRRPRKARSMRRTVMREPLFPAMDLPASTAIDRRAFGLGAGRYFVLAVVGEGMTEDGIHDGDYAVLQSQDTVEDGDIVAAVVDGKAMLRKLYREKDHIRLESSGNRREPTFAKSAAILGVVKGIMRGVGRHDPELNERTSTERGLGPRRRTDPAARTSSPPAARDDRASGTSSAEELDTATASG